MTSSPGSIAAISASASPAWAPSVPTTSKLRVALAAEHARRLVAQRLDQVGRVHVERVGHDRLAHRLDGAEAGGPQKHVSQPRSAQSAGRRVVPSG